MGTQSSAPPGRAPAEAAGEGVWWGEVRPSLKFGEGGGGGCPGVWGGPFGRQDPLGTPTPFSKSAKCCFFFFSLKRFLLLLTKIIPRGLFKFCRGGGAKGGGGGAMASARISLKAARGGAGKWAWLKRQTTPHRHKGAWPKGSDSMGEGARGRGLTRGAGPVRPRPFPAH